MAWPSRSSATTPRRRMPGGPSRKRWMSGCGRKPTPTTSSPCAGGRRSGSRAGWSTRCAGARPRRCGIRPASRPAGGVRRWRPPWPASSGRVPNPRRASAWSRLPGAHRRRAVAAAGAGRGRASRWCWSPTPWRPPTCRWPMAPMRHAAPRWWRAEWRCSSCGPNTKAGKRMPSGYPVPPRRPCTSRPWPWTASGSSWARPTPTRARCGGTARWACWP